MSDPRSVNIEAMAEGDLPEVLGLWRATEGVGLNESDKPQRLAAYLCRNPGQSSVARDTGSGELVGAVLCGNDGRRGYLHHLAVAKHARGQRVGSRLVERALQTLAALDIDKCTVFVYASNASGQQFWSKLGWYARDELMMMQMMVDCRSTSPTNTDL